MSEDKKEKPVALPKDGEPINLKQLAAILQLSQTTVSLVLNNSPAAKSIPEHTRERVFQAARKYHYRPNYFARSLRKNRSMSIGVLAPDLSEGYFTMVMNGVEEYLMRAQYFYFTASHYWDQDLMQEYPRLLVERAVDGFLLLNTPSEIRSPLPTVAISAHNQSPGVTNIILDHKRAAELALKHLYDQGHRNIAFMKGPNIIPDTEYRWRSILEVARDLGIKVHAEHCIQLEADSWSPGVGYGPMRDLLARTRDFTAIFCFNDISAIGFDDIMSAAFHKPSLTTVRQPLREMGQQGAQILLDMIAHPENNFPEEVVMQPELIVRESTGPAAAQKSKRKK